MSQKIGILLMAVLVVCGVMRLAMKEEQAAAVRPPETTAPSAVQTTAPQTGQTQPTETTAPQPETQPQTDAARRVAQALEGWEPAATAAAHRVFVPELNTAAQTQGTAVSSCGYALTELAAQRKMNPIAAFWELVSAGIYEKQAPTGSFPVSAFQVPDQAATTYDYTDEGARQLLEDLLTLAGKMEDGLALELALLGEARKVDGGRIALSEPDGCRYAYFACGGERSSHILCFYLRSGDGKTITDVEFQLLNLTSAQGSAQALAVLDRRSESQAAVLMAAAELLLTGKSRTGDGPVSGSWEVGGCKATLERFAFTGTDEWGTMTNFRIRAK